MAKENKIIIISAVSVTSITLLSTILSLFYSPKAPDPKELGPRKKISYMASKQFTRLPEKEKEKYISKVGHPQKIFKDLNKNERTAVFKNVRKVMLKKMKERIDKFSQMSQEEKNKFIDEMIARRKAMRSQNGSKSRSNAMRQGMLENTDSTTRAKMTEIRKLMQERSQNQGR